MTNTVTPPQTTTLTIDQALKQAIDDHHAGRLQEAERLYRAILQTQPNHPDANHNLGVLAVQVKQPAAGLLNFKAALEANPEQGQYWLSYIDALIQAGQTDAARQVLEQGRQRGLQGEAVEALAARMKEGAQVVTERSNAEATMFELPPESSAVVKKCGKHNIKKAAKRDKSSKKSFSGIGKTPSSQEVNKLVDLFSKGQYSEAETLSRAMIISFPLHDFGWKVLGAALEKMGRSADALEPRQKAASLSPFDVDAHNNLGNTLRSMSRLDEAEASYRRALEIKPDFAEGHNSLGNTLRALGRLDEAEASYRRAVELKPDYAEALNNLSVTLQDMGRLEEAEASCRRAVQIKPDHASPHSNLGNILLTLGRLDEAAVHYRRALEIEPNSAEVLNNLGNLLKAQGRLDDAIACYSDALQLKKDYAEAYNNLGVAYWSLGRPEEAEANCRRAVQIKPDHASPHINLGNALRSLGRLEEAEIHYRRALEIKPDSVEAHNNLGHNLKDTGRLAEAEISYRRALVFNPDYVMAHSNLLFCLSHSETVDVQALFAEHCRFSEQFEAPLRAKWPQHTNSRNPERCLQVGFVSADLSNHSVARFIEPVLAHLAGYPQFSLHVYYNNVVVDSVTQRLRGYLKHWHDIVGLSDMALAQRIREDGIDILFDLSGHTAKHRLLTFARKPAPVQASWIGYPGTTGLKAMDYYLADRYFLPHGQFDDQFTEKLVSLPASVPFLPSKDAPPVNTLPALNNNYVTFGSFNCLDKISRSVIALWSQLLRALPNARMVLGAMPQTGEDNMLIEWFASEGIGRERLDFYPKCQMKDYLGLYYQVDLCLDTFPYNGGTTTTHALWMGVPTLTLAGETVPSRVGAWALSHVGLEAFVAHNKMEFVEKGLYWAGHLAELAKIREDLRVRFEQSALGQPDVVAEALAHALRTMWQRWCAGLSAKSFEVPL